MPTRYFDVGTRIATVAGTSRTTTFESEFGTAVWRCAGDGLGVHLVDTCTVLNIRPEVKKTVSQVKNEPVPRAWSPGCGTRAAMLDSPVITLTSF